MRPAGYQFIIINTVEAHYKNHYTTNAYLQHYFVVPKRGLYSAVNLDPLCSSELKEKTNRLNNIFSFLFGHLRNYSTAYM